MNPAAPGAAGESPAALQRHGRRDLPAAVATQQRDARAARAAAAHAGAGASGRAALEGQRRAAAQEPGRRSAAEEAGGAAGAGRPRRAEPQAGGGEEPRPGGRAEDEGKFIALFICRVRRFWLHGYFLQS